MKKTLKTIYKHLPLKKEFFTVVKTILKPNEPIFRHLHFQGIFNVSIDKKRSFKLMHAGFQIENEIFWRGLFGGWEKESLMIWIKLCQRSKTIFDIGANTGIYSIVAKAVAPKAQVFSFEPNNLFFPVLQKNNVINNFDITCINEAASNIDGIIELDDYSGRTKTITIRSCTLDTFITQNSLTGIDLVKIDVEKHEPQVLEGFSVHLSKFRPSILIEILDDEIAKQIHKMLQDLNYLYFNINEKGSIRRTSSIEKSDDFNYLLCPADVAVEIGLK